MPTARRQPAKNGSFGGFGIEMLRLRIEFRREVDNFFGRDAVCTERIDLACGEILEMQALIY